MKKGTLKTKDFCGVTRIVSYLGTGMFKTAWRDEETGEVILTGKKCHGGHAADLECLAQTGYRDSEHLPEVKRLGLVNPYSYDDNRIAYKMPYYEPVTAKAFPEYWELIKRLGKLWTRSTGEFIRSKQRVGEAFRGDRDGLDLSQYFVNQLASEADIPEWVIEALQALVDSMCNWSSAMRFEFKKSAFGVDADGKLIFRDVAYDWAAIY